MTPIDDDNPASDASLLPRHLCRVMGFNKNHSSRTGTLYHLQVEDLGPIFDEATEAWVRRLNVIAYANYGEPTARIVLRQGPRPAGHAHSRAQPRRRAAHPRPGGRGGARPRGEGRTTGRSREEPARALLPHARRRRQAGVRGSEPALPARLRARLPGAQGEPNPRRPKCRLRRPRLHPSKRWSIRSTRTSASSCSRSSAWATSCGATCRRSRRAGPPTTSCRPPARKLLARAKESLTRSDSPSEFAARYLDMTRNSLVTAYRQVRARLTRVGG